VQIPQTEKPSPLRQAIELAILYILLCSTYILGSGYLATRVATTPQQLYEIETIKGIAFIVVTGALFFIISYIRCKRIRRQERIIVQQEKTLLAAERRLVAAMSVATMAHDLNNLLMAFTALVEVLKRRKSDDSALRKMCEEIEVGIDKLQRLGKSLTASVSRAVPEKDENIDLNAAIYELVTIVRKHPDVRYCHIELPAPEPLWLTLNRTLFEQATVNLLINAAQAAGTNGRIKIGLAIEQLFAVLSVHDSGQGVPDQHIKEIFEPCFTTKAGGTGIGLLAVKAFAASCGTDVSVGRSPLGGALFQIRIPLHRQLADAPVL
jgi:signal transduction histidine kinase